MSRCKSLSPLHYGPPAHVAQYYDSCASANFAAWISVLFSRIRFDAHIPLFRRPTIDIHVASSRLFAFASAGHRMFQGTCSLGIVRGKGTRHALLLDGPSRFYHLLPAAGSLRNTIATSFSASVATTDFRTYPLPSVSPFMG